MYDYVLLQQLTNCLRSINTCQSLTSPPRRQSAFEEMTINGWTPGSNHLSPHPRGSKFTLGLGARNGFTEIVRRSSGRYEYRYNTSSPPFNDSKILLNPTLITTLSLIFKDTPYRLMGRSIVLSTPNSKDQAWHVDGSHLSPTQHLPPHCLNVFIPLLDLQASHGPTSIRPRTQFYTRDLARQMLGAMCRKELLPAATPLVAAGSALLFDYRVLHRGLANTSREDRPVLVLTYAKEGFDDVYNFPER